MVRAGEVIRASDVAVQACRVTRAAVQSIPDNTATTFVAFTDEVFDTDGMHSTVTNNTRITFQTAGFYVVGFHGTLPAASTYTRVFAEILLNGSTSIGRNQQRGTTVSVQQTLFMTTMYTFSAGDYIEVNVFQDSGGAKDLEVTANRSPQFWAARIGS